VLVRGVLVLIAAAAIVFGVTRLQDTNACNDAKREGFQIALGRGVPGTADALARKVADHCRGGSDLAATGVALARAGAVAPAERLAREAVRRDPRDYLGWVSLAIVLQRRNEPAASRAAARRALALNPRYAAAQQLAAPSGAGARAGP
jgi:Flp pilus assembly protein TadD